jgi:hypothetical protein
MIIFEHMGDKPNETASIQRSWLNCNKESLIESLAAVDWKIITDTVQGYWNQFEHKLISVVDELVPLY